MEINPHHLRLFYYLAIHGSPTAAARQMPYGIDPSSLTRQICELEHAIALRLYERRRYCLTPAGEKLFALIKPVFADLPGLVAGWRKGLPDVVTLGASPVVLREYLPPILSQLQKNFPGVELICNEGTQAQIQAGLREKAIDLAVTTWEGTLPTGYERIVLARLPLILLVPRKSRLRSANQFLAQKHVAEKLVSLPADNPITVCFRQGLKRRGVDWPPGLAANSIELVETYVSRGFGIGLSLLLPSHNLTRAGLRALPLRDFPRVPVGLVWKRNPGATLEALIKELRRVAGQIIKDPAERE